DIAPGFRLEVTPPVHGYVSPRIVKELSLGARGFTQTWSDVAVVTPRRDGGNALVLHRDIARSTAEIAKHSEADAKAFEPFAKRLHALAGFLESLYEKEPPRITSNEAADLLALVGT